MKKSIASLLLIPGLLFSSIAVSGESDARLREMKPHLDEARHLTGQLYKQIASELARELEMSGPMRAIIVCRYTAPEATSAIARQTGIRVTRVSLRPRNRALGEPDAWEQQILLDFERRAARGENVESLEHAEIVEEPAGRFFRYMRAIPMQPVCQACHGEKISAGVKAQLSLEYPHDKATDYRVGNVRGAFSVKKPL